MDMPHPDNLIRICEAIIVARVEKDLIRYCINIYLYIYLYININIYIYKYMINREEMLYF